MLLQPQTIALFFTVALLAVTAYFLLGSVPLLTLKHDNPMDARFIRSFYITYYRIAFLAAVGTTISYTLAGRPAFAIGAAAIAILTLLLRNKFIPMMDLLAPRIVADHVDAIPAFRKIHKSAILINTSQLLAILGSLSVV
jgi:mitochondrial fission protein ELM1